MGAWARLETAHHNRLGFAGPLFYQLANGGPTPSSPFFNDVILASNGLSRHFGDFEGSGRAGASA